MNSSMSCHSLLCSSSVKTSAAIPERLLGSNVASFKKKRTTGSWTHSGAAALPYLFLNNT